MSNDRSANSSDLALAGRISRRLRGDEAPPPPVVEDTGDRGYVRFRPVSRAMPAAVQAASPPPMRVAPALDPNEVRGSAGWGRILEWCVGAFDARAAFVMDEQGLVVGSLGALDTDAAQAAGARLIMAFEHADQMDGTPGTSRTISIELDELWMTGLRIPFGDEGRMTVGLLCADPVGAVAREAIRDAFAHKAGGA